jgi:cation-transporting ATPase E
LTVVSSLTIGIPAFFLALEPNMRRYIPGFIRRVVRFAGPAGIVLGTTTFVSYAIAYYADDLSLNQQRTAATLTLMIGGLWVLNLLARPITPLRGVLFGAMAGAFVGILAIPPVRDWFEFHMPHGYTAVAIACGVVAGAILEVAWQVNQHRQPPGDRTARLALRNPASVRR